MFDLIREWREIHAEGREISVEDDMRTVQIKDELLKLVSRREPLHLVVLKNGKIFAIEFYSGTVGTYTPDVLE